MAYLPRLSRAYLCVSWAFLYEVFVPTSLDARLVYGTFLSGGDKFGRGIGVFVSLILLLLIMQSKLSMFSNKQS